MSKKRKIVLKEVHEFRESVKRVVAMLSGKKIPVAERGNDAYVEYNKKGEPILVNIPSIPDDASPALMIAVRGFLDHEVAHLLFTDSEIAIRLRDKTKKAPSVGLWNALEDVFIERKMGQVFNGTRRNLLTMQNLLINKYFTPKVEEAVNICAGDQRKLFMNFFLCPVLRAWDGQTPFIAFMDNHWKLIEKPVSLLKEHGIDEAIRNMSCSADCLKVAAAIAQIMRDMKSNPEGTDYRSSSEHTSKEKSVSGEDSSEEDNPSAKDISKFLHTKDKEVNDTKPSTNEAKTDSTEEVTESDDNNESEHGERDSGAPSDGDGDENDPIESDCHSAEESDEEGKNNKDTNDEIDASETDGEELSNPCDAESSSVISDDMTMDEAIKTLECIDETIDEMTEDALSATIKEELKISSSPYRPYDRTYDFMGIIDTAEEYLSRTTKAFKSPKPYSSIDRYRIVPEGLLFFEKHIEKHLSKGVSSTLAKDLERAIASKNRIQHIPGQRRGRIHGANLYRLSMNDERVFRKKEEHRAVNACVNQVVDLSGSMDGPKIQLALASAYTIADALDRINVPNIITGFTTFGDPYSIESKHGFTRFEALMLPIIKNWNEKANSTDIRTRMGCLCTTFPLLNNVDGESIAQLASLFSGRMEDKKIMMVLSDGIPSALGRGFSEHLKQIANEIETTSDINLMAIGILTDAPKSFYKNHALVRKVDELGSAVVTELSRIILN